MRDFWFWFIRPVAEFLGGLALWLAFVLIVVAVLAVVEWRSKR